MEHLSLSVIVPAYNEEQFLQDTINAIINWPVQMEVIIVDDGSIDSTSNIIKNLEAIYPTVKGLILQNNVGKGQALMKGISLAKGDVLLFLDADLKSTAKYGLNLITPIFNRECDMTIAVFPKGKKKGGFGLVKKLARTGIFVLTGYKAIAPLSGQRAISSNVFKQLNGLSEGFGIEVGLTIDVLRLGYQIKEVEIPFNHRESGRDLAGFIHRGKQFTAVLFALLRKVKA